LPQIATQNPFAMARLGLQPLILMALIVYFLSGFLLMSQARLQMASANWLHNDVTTSKRVEKNWHRNSIRVLVIIAFLAALLPIGSTTGIGRILDSLVALIVGLVSLLYLFFIALLALLLPQSPDTGTDVLPTQAPQPTLEVFPPTEPIAPNETAAFIFSSALFWSSRGSAS